MEWPSEGDFHYVNKSMLCAPPCFPIMYSENISMQAVYIIRGIFGILQFSNKFDDLLVTLGNLFVLIP